MLMNLYLAADVFPLSLVGDTLVETTLAPDVAFGFKAGDGN